MPTILGQVGGRQVEGDTAGRVLQRAVEDGAAHAVLAFLDGGFRQAHQGKRWKTIGHMHFDGNGGGFYANLGTAVDDGEGHARSLSGRPLPAGFSRVDEVRCFRGREVLLNVSKERRRTPWELACLR